MRQDHDLAFTRKPAPASVAGALVSRRFLMRAATASLILLYGLAACAGPGGPSPRGGLMYEVPDPPTRDPVPELDADRERILAEFGE